MNYTVKFDFNTKELITTNKITILFQENMVDRLLFYVNTKYLENDLGNYVCLIKYITVDSELKYEVLPLSTDESVQKEGYLAYTLNVDSDFTENTGFIKYCMLLTKLDTESNIQYILRSKQNSIYISPVKDAYDVVENDTSDIEQAIEALEGHVDNLDALTAIIQTTMPEDIVIDNGSVILTNSNGTMNNGIDLEDLGDALVEANAAGLEKMLTD